MTDLLTAERVMERLHYEVDQAGGQSAWARRNGVDRSYLNQVLRGHKEPGAMIISALNLERVVMYRPTKKD